MHARQVLLQPCHADLCMLSSGLQLQASSACDVQVSHVGRHRQQLKSALVHLLQRLLKQQAAHFPQQQSCRQAQQSTS